MNTQRQKSTAASLPSGPHGEQGLSSEQARARLAQYGPNHLVPEKHREGLWVWVFRAFADPMVLLLLVAGVTYLLLQDYVDSIITLVAVAPITMVSLILEIRAERTLEQLKRLTAPTTAVWRDGQRQTIPAAELVPGDLVFLQEGDVIPADGMLVEGSRLMLNESALTGESQPVVKNANSGHDDSQMLAGTTLLSGRGVARITATGANTGYGKIGTLVASIRQPPTPLQRLIRRLVLQLAVVAFVFCIAVAMVELARGHGWGTAIIAGVSLAIAAIPEEFPMVYTLYLTLGAFRLARDRALIRRLPGVETLGATSVICTDKTGTLTMGHVEVSALSTVDGVARATDSLSPQALNLLEAAVLASEPNPFDPLDQAILQAAASHGVYVEALHAGKLLQDYPFDQADKYISHVWQHAGATRVCAKGSIEGILARSQASPEIRQRALEANHALAMEGMRILAVAAGDSPQPSGDRSSDERELQFTGLVAFADPVRPGVVEALKECGEAGIRVIMITGDHPVTAHAVVESLGLPHDDQILTGDDLDAADEETLAKVVQRVNVFARTRPEQKFRLVQALGSLGHVVAMTGDGINDAPALREADIGIAMGQRGTEVARASATMVLLDDNFATIVGAVRDGRRIFENLRRAFSYLIAFHVPLLLSALIVPLTGAPLMLLPIHIVWLELVVHPVASLVFEADPASPDLMRRKPRKPNVGLLTGMNFLRPFIEGLSLSAGVVVLYLVLLGRGALETDVRAMALATMIMGQAALVMVERAPSQPVWRVSIRGNKALPAVLGATIASLFLAMYIPPLAGFLKLGPLHPEQWAVAVAVAAVAVFWMEPVKAWKARREVDPKIRTDG